MVLPIGSVIYLKNGYEKMVVLRRGIQVKYKDQSYFFDYAGSLYPNGEEIYYFNDDNIEKVIFRGYIGDEEKQFEKIYDDLKNDGEIPLLSVEEVEQQIKEEQDEEKEPLSRLFNNV